MIMKRPRVLAGGEGGTFFARVLDISYLTGLRSRLHYSDTSSRICPTQAQSLEYTKIKRRAKH